MRRPVGIWGVFGALAIHTCVWAQDAQTPPVSEPETPAQRRLAELKVEQEIAEAEKAIRDANSTLIPTSGVEGTVTIGEGGGGPEVLAIAARQMEDGAFRIISQTKDPGDRGLWVATGAEVPETTAWQFFVVRQEALEASLKATTDALATAESGPRSAYSGMGVGTAISAASALLSYLRSDFSVAGVAVTGLDDAALAAAVIAAAPGRIQLLDTASIQSSTLIDIHDRLKGLDVLRDRLEPARLSCVETDRALEAALEGADTDDAKARIRRGFVERLDACRQIKALIADYDAFVAFYASDDGALMGKVIQQAELSKRMTERDLLLVKLHQVSGAGYTQINLVSHLGGMPYHVTTASVISWQRLNSDGRVTDSGWVPLYFGYRRLGDVDKIINGDCSSAAGCPPTRQATFEAADGQSP